MHEQDARGHGAGDAAAPAAEAGAHWFGERLGQLPLAAARHAERVAVLDTANVGAGTMPPLHTRDRDESYYIVEGEVVFYVGDEIVRARAGDAVLAPRGAPRTFRVISDTARWLVMTTLRSLSRYEDFTSAVARPSPDQDAGIERWQRGADAAAVAAIAAANGVTLLGPPGMLPSDLRSPADGAR